MPTISPELPLNVDSTMLSCFRSCPEKFRNEFVLGLRPAALSVDLHAGGCFASALEAAYEAIHVGQQPLDKALQIAYGKFLQEWGDFVPMKETPKTQDRVWEAVEEYFRQWPPLTDPVQPFINGGRPSFEFTFGIPLLPIAKYDTYRLVMDGNWDGYSTYSKEGFPLHPSGSPFIYSGRFDMLGQMGSKLVVRDEKTTKSIGNDWASQWDLRSQFLGYCWACQQSGLSVDTVVVRGVGILKTKISLVEAIKTYQQFMIDKWLEQVRRDLWRLRRAWDEGYFDYNLADACSSYGGCAFRDLCGSPAPERWYGNYVVKRWNPLQKNPIDETAGALGAAP